MIEKACKDELHEGEGALPLTEFYRNPLTADGRLGICIECSKRRSAERRQRLWEENKQAEKVDPRVVSGTENLRRWREERAEDDSYQHREAGTPGPVELRGFGFGEPESDFEPERPAFVGLVDRFFRQPVIRSKGWKVA